MEQIIDQLQKQIQALATERDSFRSDHEQIILIRSMFNQAISSIHATIGQLTILDSELY